MTTKKKNCKNLLIPENDYEKDFGFIVGFYAYHVKNKDIAVSLSDISNLGVNIEAKKKKKEIELIDINMLSTNVIYFSSTEKKKNVKNLMWCIRCLAHHPENIEIVNQNGTAFYKLWCGHKDNIKGVVIPTMLGLVDCNVWPNFIRGLMDKITENETN